MYFTVYILTYTLAFEVVDKMIFQPLKQFRLLHMFFVLYITRAAIRASVYMYNMAGGDYSK